MFMKCFILLGILMTILKKRIKIFLLKSVRIVVLEIEKDHLKVCFFGGKKMLWIMSLRCA